MTDRGLSLHALREFGIDVYSKMGVPAQSAAIVTEVQLAADLRGVDTHGFQRLPWYVGYIERGENAPDAVPSVIAESAVHVHLDANNAIGQLACVRLMEATLEKARSTGLAVGASRNSNDWGCGAYYPLMAAREGFVCFATTTSVPTLAPFGSRTRLSGNNPMVFGSPRRSDSGPPVVLDMALTPVAIGKVLRAQAEGQQIPSEWGFRDRDGAATTDPSTALRGIMPAIGGYKGTGLSLMMNLLAGVLPQGFHTAAVAPGKRGQFFLVVSPELFGDREAFLDGVEDMCAQVKSAEPLPGQSVYLPGEIEHVREQEALARGTIHYPPSVVAALAETGAKLGVDVGFLTAVS